MKKLKKTRSLTTKLLITAVGVLLGMLLLLNMLGVFVFNGIADGKNGNAILIVCVVGMIVIASIFIIIVYYVLLKRIIVLNKAVQKVAKGDYTVAVSDKGNDELSLLAENFNTMTKELQANAMLSKDFISYVSHELKTPLSVIRTHAEALAETDDDEQRSYAEVIIDETDGLADMSKNIITLCKLDNTNLVPKNDVFSPAEQIRSFILSTQALFASKNLNISLDLAEFEVKGNAGLTYLIWQNIIGNAFKFTGNGGNVKIKLTKTDDWFQCIVSDDGIGIADEDKDKIFTLFFTGNKTRNKEGNGIGLYLTKSIVTKLGGGILLSSRQNEGSCFTINLPIEKQ